MMNVSFLVLMFILPTAYLSSHSCIIDDCSSSINVFLSNKSCSELKISNGTFMLEENSATNVITMSDFKISGTGNTTIKCKPNAGLAFKNVSNIEIQNVTFNNCGMIFNSTSEDPNSADTTLISKAALLFEYCTNVSLTSVIVNGSDGIGVQMYNTVGNVNISHSIFSENKIKKKNYISGGGGLYIEFSFCEPGTIGINNCKSTNSSFIASAKYNISFSQFIYNRGSATDPERVAFIRPGYYTHYAFGRGGGMSVYIKGKANCNTFLVDNCIFKGNVALFGAGMCVEFQDNSRKNVLTVQNSVFSSNKIISKKLGYTGTSGGGFLLAYVIFNPNKGVALYNKAAFINTTFTANAAFTGGGFSFHTSKEKNVTEPTNVLRFVGCHWRNNKARLGAAIDLSIQHSSENGQLVKPSFKDCTFINNVVTGSTINESNGSYSISDVNSTGYWPGAGIMYLDAITVIFIGNLMFTNNKGGAIVAIDAGINIHQHSSVNFSKNQAESGGALHLLGYSWIAVSKHVQVSFVNNSARRLGGAIYYQVISEQDQPSSGNCFIRYINVSAAPYDWEKLKVSFLFLDNRADQGGDAIYITTVVDCAWNGSMSSPTDASLKNIFSNFTFKPRNSNSIQTAARSIKSNLNTKKLKIIPGKAFEFPFTAQNDFGDTTSAIFMIFSSDKNVSIPNPVIQTDGTTVLKTSKVNSSFYLQFETEDNRKHVGYIMVTVEKCPMGYFLNNDTCECVTTCHPNSYQGLAYCNTSGLDWHIVMKPGHWGGYVKPGDFFSTYACPFAYSIQSDTPIAVTNDSDVLCKNRMGTLCGDCKHGYGLSVGTLECVNCTSTSFIAWLIFITTTYIPITVVFVLLLVLNINFAVGPINSFIFFCQVFPAVSLDNNHWGNYGSAIAMISNIHYGIVRIMSLKFGTYVTTNYCLFPTMNTMDYYVFQYASALYPLLILGIIVCIIKYCPARYFWRAIRRCVNAIMKRTSFEQAVMPLHGFIAFLQLTYVNFVHISFRILAFAYFEDKIGQNKTAVVPFMQGTMEYFGEHHWPYGLTALFFLLIFGILPWLLLIIYPVILTIIKHFKWDNTRKVHTLRKWIPLYNLMFVYDNYWWSEFKPKCRVFAGLYFLYRFVAFFTFSFAPTIYQIYFGLSILFMIIMLLHGYIQPYKKQSYNRIDLFIFAIISVVNSLYGYSEFLRTQFGSHSTAEAYLWIGTILAWVPIVFIVCYILFKRCKGAKQSRLLTLGNTSSNRYLESLLDMAH